MTPYQQIIAQLANQHEIIVRCQCGWQGRAPTELVEIMGTGDMACPQCLAMFSKWPRQTMTAPQDR
jgi:hypothetical protein